MLYLAANIKGVNPVDFLLISVPFSTIAFTASKFPALINLQKVLTLGYSRLVLTGASYEVEAAVIVPKDKAIAKAVNTNFFMMLSFYFKIRLQLKDAYKKKTFQKIYTLNNYLRYALKNLLID
ncbi:hypothetical protein TASCI_30279 [Tenacibaculum ascidiaceicola]